MALRHNIIHSSHINFLQAFVFGNILSSKTKLTCTLSCKAMLFYCVHFTFSGAQQDTTKSKIHANAEDHNEIGYEYIFKASKQQSYFCR